MPQLTTQKRGRVAIMPILTLLELKYPPPKGTDVEQMVLDAMNKRGDNRAFQVNLKTGEVTLYAWPRKVVQDFEE